MKTPLYRLAAVVELIDGFLDRPAQVQGVRFSWDGKQRQALVKPQSRYVFLSVLPGEHVLQVDAPPFLPCTMTVALPEEAVGMDRMVRCVLSPGARYVYPTHTTMIRGSARDLPDGARISADYRSSLGRPHHVETQAEGDRDYILVLPGKLANATEVTLRVNLPDGADGQRAVVVMPGHTLRVDILPH